MKTASFLLTIVTSLCLSTAAWGQRTLSSAEVQQIVQKVTSQPRNTWISVGTITATHQEFGVPNTDEATIQSKINEAVQKYNNSTNKPEQTPDLQTMKLAAIPFNVRYNLANDWAMSSHVTVKYANSRFYWEINVDSRSDSVKPDASLAGNYMTEQFNLSWNQHRIFAWDGQEYTTYSVSGNQATVDAAGKLPHVVTGPLTAGLIPWGYGRFSSANLATAQAKQNAAGTIDMTISRTDGTSALTLDPAKAYAVTTATLTNGGGSTVTYTCSDYRQVAGNWVPYDIRIDRQNPAGSNSKLPTSEHWTFSSVSTAAPGSFNVSMAANALVEYSSPVTASSAIYVQSNTVDTRGLLVQRLAFAAAEGSRQQNCATAAVQEVASELGKSIPDSALARLVGPDGRTSMYEMKRLAQSQGLFCRAVKTDLAALRTLSGVKAILHIPGKNHFVVLHGVDDRDVWVTDLSSRKFFYHQSVDFFPMDWSEGTALLLSDRPIPSQSNELADTAVASIAGGTGYACNQLVQEFMEFFCDNSVLGCDGAVIVYYERWGCGQAPSGSCSNQPMVKSLQSLCDWEPGIECTITGDWYYYYMLACG
jgi:hypothetical protein